MPGKKKPQQPKKKKGQGRRKKVNQAGSPASRQPKGQYTAKVTRDRDPTYNMAAGRASILRGLSEAANRMEQGAAQWVAYKNDPFSGKYRGTRIPDMLGWATATAELRETFGGPSMTIAAGDTVQYWFAPTFNSAGSITDGPTFATRTSTGGGAFGPWTLGLSSNQATINANVGSFRTVAFGVRALNTTPALSRGGTITVLRCFQPGSLVATPATVRRDPSAQTMDMGTEAGTVVRRTWDTSDYESAIDQRTPSAGYQSGGILFEVSAGSTQQTMDFSTVHGIEFIPLPSAAPMYEVANVEGDSGAAATVTSYLYQAIGAVSDVATDFVSDQLAAAAGRMLEQLGGMVRPALTAGSPARAALALEAVKRKAVMRKFLDTVDLSKLAIIGEDGEAHSWVPLDYEDVPAAPAAPRATPRRQ